MFKLIPRGIRNSIRNKVFFSFLIVLLLVTAVFITSYRSISKLGIASDNILKMNYNSIIAAIQMLDAIETIESNSSAYAVTLDSDKLNEIVQKQHQFSQWIGRAKDNITEAGEKNTLSELDSLYTQYSLYVNRQLSGMEFAGKDTVRSEIRDRVKNKCYELLSLNQKAMFAKSTAAQKIAKQGIASLLMIVTAVFSLGLILSYGLSYRIVKPIYQLLTATQKIADGDYTGSIHSDLEDELGELTNKFNDMTDKLKAYNDVNLRTILEEQQKIKAIFTSINDGLIFIGTDYVIMEANEKAFEILNCTGDKLLGHHFLEVVHEDKLFHDLKHCIETNSAPEFPDMDNLITTLHKDRKSFYQYFFNPIKDREGLLLGAMFLIRDVTNIKELDQLKSKFFMIVSHELKTPLTSLSMSVDLIRESLGDQLNAANLELIDAAKEDINRLKALIHDLLDLSKIEAGKIELEFHPVQTEETIRLILNHFKSQVQERKITLEYNNTGPVPKVFADEEKLILVFNNLISNALRYVNDMGNIIIGAEPSGKFATFSVTDDGAGIPLAFQNRMFDRFVQLKGQNNAKGTGLGLTICREIVRAHGGTIWVESEPGKGSAFFFTIPLAEENILRS